jgi:hypothetical protein
VTVLAISRCVACGELSVLIDDDGQAVALGGWADNGTGVPCRQCGGRNWPNGAWWCECTPRTLVHRPEPFHNCRHFELLGTLAARARDLAARAEPGTDRAAAQCVAAVLEVARDLRGARKLLRSVNQLDVRRAAVELLDDLAGMENT